LLKCYAGGLDEPDLDELKTTTASGEFTVDFFKGIFINREIQFFTLSYLLISLLLPSTCQIILN